MPIYWDKLENATCIPNSAGAGISSSDAWRLHLRLARRQRPSRSVTLPEKRTVGRFRARDWPADSVRLGVRPANGVVDSGAADFWEI